MMPLPKIYIESCQFIDMAIYHAKLPLHKDASEAAKREANVWHCDKLLQAAREKQVRILTSFITIAECTTIKDGNPVPSDDVKRFYMSLLSSGKSGVELIQPTLGIMDRARGLRWNSGITLGGIDSVHLASAILLNCEEFLTTDGKFFTNSAKIQAFGVRVCPGAETKLLPSKYFQHEFQVSPTQTHETDQTSSGQA